MIMKKFSNFVIKYKVYILLIFAIVLVLSILGTVFLVVEEDKINSDMMSYFADDFDTKKGFDFLETNFNIRGDATIVVRGQENDPELTEKVEKIRKMTGVSQLIWVEDAKQMEEFQTQIEALDFDFGDIDLVKLEEQMSKNALFKGYTQYIKLMDLQNMTIDTSGLQSFLKRPVEGGESDYVLLIMMEYSPSTSQAYALLDSIKLELSGRPIASAGMTETAQTVLDDTIKDLPNFLIYAVIAVIIILLLTTSSFIEPLILVFTLGVSILISMGINYLYPSISIISFATSAVLQLAITLDYAIFYMHTYKRHRQTVDATLATKAAIPEVASSIFASALTTIGGFVALYFMRFGIGSDIANVIIKGIALSLITVLFLQPILTIMLDKLIIKTSHNFNAKINKKRTDKNPNATQLSKETILRPVARFTVWQRIILIVVAAALLIPTFVGQSKLTYSYFQMYDNPQDTPEKVIAYELGNQMIMAVPLEIKTGTHQDFINEILQDPTDKVGGVLGAFTMLDVESDTLKAVLNVLLEGYNAETNKNVKLEALQKMLRELPANARANPTIYRNIFEEMGMDMDEVLDSYDFENIDIVGMLEDVDLSVLSSYFAKKDGEWYTLYNISIIGSAEDETAAKCYEYLNTVQVKYFGEKSYSIGMLTGSYDMREVTPIDFLRVTVVSVLIIFLIVALLLRNPLKSFIMVAIIELGIWINLSIAFLAGIHLNFMIYIILSSVQLGCTVDYAILFANTFEKNRSKYASSKECAVQSAVESLPAIFTSALIIMSVCLSVFTVSKNIMIKQLTGMLAMGAVISSILVAFVQTAVWSFFKTERKRINFNEKIEHIDKKITEQKETTPRTKG